MAVSLAGRQFIRRVAVLPLAADYIATGSKTVAVALTAGKSAKLALEFAKYNYVSGTVYQDLNGDVRRGAGEKTTGKMNFFVDID